MSNSTTKEQCDWTRTSSQFPGKPVTRFSGQTSSSNPTERRRHAYVRIIERLRGENGINKGLTRILIISFFFFFSWAYLSSRRCLWCWNFEILFRSSFTLRLSSSSSSLPYIFHHPPHPCWYALTLGAILWELVWRSDDRLTMKPIQKFFSYTDACHNALIRVTVYRHGEGQYLYPRKAAYNIYTYTYNVSGFGADLTWHFICFCARNIPILS